MPSAYLHLAFAASGDPEDGFANVNLEAAAVELGFLEFASSQFGVLENCITRPDETAVHYFNKGKILYRRNNYRGAVEAFQTCIAANPKHADAPIRMIESMQADGRTSEALDIALPLINGTIGPSLDLLSVISDFPDSSLRQLAPRIQPNIEMLACPDLNDQTMRDFILARIYHVTGNYEKAWQTARAANLCKRDQVRAEREKDRHWEQKILDWSRSGNFPASSGLPHTKSIPLFILGPSRSGKTTLETLLSNVHGVRRGYENKLLSNAVSKANSSSGRLPSGFLPFLPDSLLPAFFHNYHRLIEKRSSGSSVFTTTTPGLIAYVPSILAALPGAKFVLMRRSSLDLLVRTYFKSYRSGHYHAYDPNWIIEYIDWYEQLSQQWEKVFPGSVRILSYEELVADTVGVVSDILEWLGLRLEASLSALVVGDDRYVSEPYIPILKKEESIDSSYLNYSR